MNARHIKNVLGYSEDEMDGEWICKLLLAGILKPSYIPPKEQRQLRDLVRSQQAYPADNIGEKLYAVHF